MCKPRRDPRVEPPHWTAEALRDLDGESAIISGVIVAGQQTDAVRAAANRAMVTKMRAAEEARATVRRAKQGANNRKVWAQVSSADRAARLTEEGLRQWAKLRAGYGTVPRNPTEENL